MNGVIIGAASSGSGKTTFSMGLMRALCRRGLVVQPFKCGPDYIDPLFHRMASGRESVNLDTRLASRRHVGDLYAHYGAGADIGVVEGVMGLFDGFEKARGSSAEMASLLGLPVVLLVNARSAAYSVAPLIQGFKTFRCEATAGVPLRLAGVVFNNVGSERHLGFLQEACRDAGVVCLGFLPRNERLIIPGRHLGLTLTAREEMERVISLAADEVEKHVDLETLLSLTSEGQPPRLSADLFSQKGQMRISVAHDEAFNFVYRANLDALATLGTLTFFSPLHDQELPACDLLYLPGGYPELFAETLQANAPMRRQIRDYAEQGGRVMAECGGFMYLCRDIDGRAMCGVFPFSATMEQARLHLGYRQLRCGKQTVGGHEFHYSSARGMPDEGAVYRYRNVLAGYPHWYWAETGFQVFDYAE